MVFVSSSLSPDTRVCGRNSDQSIAVQYIINFGNIYQNGPPEARKLHFGEYTQTNYWCFCSVTQIMKPFFIMKELGKGALGVSERIKRISIITYGKNSLDLYQLELRPALGNELSW
jgi:hypothetical protein